MGGEWEEMLLGDVVELKRGYDLPQQERRAGGVPVVSSSGVTDYHAEAMVDGPGVVTGRYGTLGQVFYITQDFWPLNTTLYVRDFKGNNPRFISYFLRSIDFLAYSDKAAVPGLNRNHLHTAIVRFPTDLAEQSAIAQVLGTLDDKIELNRRMNETLEALAQSLFQEWFVAPTRDGLPEGWREGTVEDFAMLSREAIDPGESRDETFDHFSIPAFDEGRIPKAETGNTIRSNKFIVPADSVLLSKLNPRIPRVWLPDLCGPHRAVCSTEFLVALPRVGISREFLYCLFSNTEFVNTFTTFVTGTSGSHQRVKPESLLGMDATIPPASLVERFTRATKPLLDRVRCNIRESQTLAALRDTLLPKLLSGEIRVLVGAAPRGRPNQTNWRPDQTGQPRAIGQYGSGQPRGVAPTNAGQSGQEAM